MYYIKEPELNESIEKISYLGDISDVLAYVDPKSNKSGLDGVLVKRYGKDDIVFMSRKHLKSLGCIKYYRSPTLDELLDLIAGKITNEQEFKELVEQFGIQLMVEFDNCNIKICELLINYIKNSTECWLTRSLNYRDAIDDNRVMFRSEKYNIYYERRDDIMFLVKNENLPDFVKL